MREGIQEEEKTYHNETLTKLITNSQILYIIYTYG